MPIATINPATGETEEVFDPHDRAEVERRIGLASAAFDTLKRTTFEERGRWMASAADILTDDLDAVAATVTREVGKPIVASRAEIEKCVRGLRYYAEHAEELLADEAMADPGLVGAAAAGARFRPLGVVLAVMPWNFPFWQVIRFAAPALMAGNSGLLKHASNVPRAALYLDRLFARAGFPEGALTAVLVDSREVEAIIADPRIAAVTLTGSEPAGRAVASRAASRIKKAVLELGGSDPFIVMPSADLAGAVTTAVAARMQNSGQSCIAAKRFIIHTDVYDEFLERFTAAMAALTVGDPLLEDTQVGPLATSAGRDDIAALVDDARARGARVLTGGSVPDGVGWFYPPTVLSDVTPDMRIHLEEAFGPVATVYRVADAPEAVELANTTRFGLSSAVWTRNVSEQEYFVERLDAGGVFLNGMTASYPELAFGGIKSSGYGRELGGAGIKEFCNLKTVWRALG